uniref:Methylmalonyl-CoA mutase C-terminal domain-containing protein n=1 Tax=Candidatus Kentrum sp. LPFa TaxID=2126335 RepID=A0A450W9Y7_9GAMM|nr:MAG: methylmalonyl-CoA mutase C-terminal domain-containing protein [Candidatus Kentron sp. LPFa]
MASGRVAIWSRWFPFRSKVKVGTLFEMPDKVARQAIENDAHVIGRGAKDPGHKSLLPELVKELVKELKGLDREDTMVVVGGVITVQDYDFLYENGASAIFG